MKLIVVVCVKLPEVPAMWTENVPADAALVADWVSGSYRVRLLVMSLVFFFVFRLKTYTPPIAPSNSDCDQAASA